MNLPLPDRLDTFAIILDESIVYQDTSRNENTRWKEKDNTKAVVILLAGLFFLLLLFSEDDRMGFIRASASDLMM